MVDVLVGPAGAGDHRDVSVAAGVGTEHGRGSVVGLAPSAVAAQVLADDLGIQTENTAKWLDTHDRAGETFRKVSSSSSTRHRWRARSPLTASPPWRRRPGRRCCWSGTTPSFQSVTAGGAFSLLVHDRDDAPELVDRRSSTRGRPRPSRCGMGAPMSSTPTPNTVASEVVRRRSDRRRLHRLAQRHARRASQCARDRLERVRPGAQQPGTR